VQRQLAFVVATEAHDELLTVDMKSTTSDVGSVIRVSRGSVTIGATGAPGRYVVSSGSEIILWQSSIAGTHDRIRRRRSTPCASILVIAARSPGGARGDDHRGHSSGG
jgi:hypothetical protein